MRKRAALSRSLIVATVVAVAFVFLQPPAPVRAQERAVGVCCFCTCQANQINSCTLVSAAAAFNTTLAEGPLVDECATHCTSVGCQLAGVEFCPVGVISPACTGNPAPTASVPALIGLVLLLSGLAFYRMRQRA